MSKNSSDTKSIVNKLLDINGVNSEKNYNYFAEQLVGKSIVLDNLRENKMLANSQKNMKR